MYIMYIYIMYMYMYMYMYVYIYVRFMCGCFGAYYGSIDLFLEVLQQNKA